MAFMTWLPEYDFGIPEIDEQHHKWIELLNSFYEGVKSNAGRTELLQLLDNALAYTAYHFEEEEQMMEDIGYEALIDQKRHHMEIGEKIEGLRADIADGKAVETSAVIDEFKDLFVTHILEEDKKYVGLYKKKQASV
jgi:hemerythrin